MHPTLLLLAAGLLLPMAPTVADPALVGAALLRENESPESATPLDWLTDAREPRSAGQVSIEQHIIIRIAPRAPFNPDPRVAMPQDAADRESRPRFEERAFGKCVQVGSIAGVQVAAANRLILMMRDRRMVAAGLEKGCTAQDFYSGFYVARSADGMMCTGRDKLQSRNGASCKLGKLKQIVPADD